MELHKGDVLRVPVATDGMPAAVRVYSLVIDDVHETTEGRVYVLRDQSGPAVCIREARLRWLEHRFERALQGA